MSPAFIPLIPGLLGVLAKLVSNAWFDASNHLFSCNYGYKICEVLYLSRYGCNSIQIK